MQLAKLRIESFRRIESLDLDFTDALGRVRDVTLLVAPNGAGKTTILDAVAAAIGSGTRLPALRSDLTLSTPHVVRKGAPSAKVTCELRFSQEEIDMAREVQERVDRVFPRTRPPVPDAREVKLTWTYPDPGGRTRNGLPRTEPREAWTLLKTRARIARLLQARVGEAEWLKHAGQVVTIDQQRTALARTIRRDMSEIIQGGVAGEDDDDDDAHEGEVHTSDPRTILLDLAVRSALPRRGGGKPDDMFGNIRETYDRVCAPRRMIGPIEEADGRLDLQFTDGVNEYGYDGVSGGEAMVLLFLTKLVSERVHRSVVLVDELELHQHPVWQSRLLYALPRIGEHNQIIATTHSEYLRDLVPRGALKDATRSDGVIELQPLDDAGQSAHA